MGPVICDYRHGKQREVRRLDTTLCSLAMSATKDVAT